MPNGGVFSRIHPISIHSLRQVKRLKHRLLFPRRARQPRRLARHLRAGVALLLEQLVVEDGGGLAAGRRLAGGDAVLGVDRVVGLGGVGLDGAEGAKLCGVGCRFADFIVIASAFGS